MVTPWINVPPKKHHISSLAQILQAEVRGFLDWVFVFSCCFPPFLAWLCFPATALFSWCDQGTITSTRVLPFPTLDNVLQHLSFNPKGPQRSFFQKAKSHWPVYWWALGGELCPLCWLTELHSILIAGSSGNPAPFIAPWLDHPIIGSRFFLKTLFLALCAKGCPHWKGLSTF